MSKLLNVIAYSLACLLTCTNWALSCTCEHLAKNASQIIVAHLEMISILFMHAYLAWDWSPYAYGDFAQFATLLNFIYSSLLHVCYLLVVYLWGLNLIFANLGTLLSIVALNICWYNCCHTNRIGTGSSYSMRELLLQPSDIWMKDRQEPQQPKGLK
jgi:hypothetical protein